MSKPLFERVEVRRCRVCETKYEHPTEGHGHYCSHTCWEADLLRQTRSRKHETPVIDQPGPHAENKF